MERRKFLIGAGSAAVGTSALVGSGAFTSIQATRAVNVNVANDENAFLGLSAPDSLKNGEYATTPSEDGTALSLNFDGSADITGSGNGLNENALTTFDEVFMITNQGNHPIDVTLDKSGLANPSRWVFVPRDYYDEDMQGSEDSFYPSWDDFDYLESNASAGGLGVGDSLKVSIQIDTRGTDALAGGDITFAVVDKNSDQGSSAPQ